MNTQKTSLFDLSVKGRLFSGFIAIMVPILIVIFVFVMKIYLLKALPTISLLLVFQHKMRLVRWVQRRMIPKRLFKVIC